MAALAGRTRVVQAQHGAIRWEVATRPLAPHVARFVRDMTGYSEHSPSPLARREYPSPKVVVIIDLGPPISVAERGDPGRAARYPGGFVAGLDDGFTLTEHAGHQRGVQLNLTPLGAQRLFRVPMSELTGRVVALPDLLPRAQRCLAEQLHDLSSWDARFDVLDRLLAERIGEPATQLSPMEWAVARIEASAGTVDIAGLVRELGYSHKHTLRLFREHVGVAPKLLARLTRFERMLRHLRSGKPASFAELAARYGYYDEAHLARDVRQFTGASPSELRPAAAEVGDLFG